MKIKLKIGEFYTIDKIVDIIRTKNPKGFTVTEELMDYSGPELSFGYLKDVDELKKYFKKLLIGDSAPPATKIALKYNKNDLWFNIDTDYGRDVEVVINGPIKKIIKKLIKKIKKYIKHSHNKQIELETEDNTFFKNK